jgi:dipeptide/tripeptide permease
MVCTPAVLAFLAGLFHSLSGPGEVLGVIPAMQLNTTHAVLYLCTFCVTSALVMGGFVSFYGSLCKKLVERAGKKDERNGLSRAFLIEVGSASLSVVISIVWLTLLAVGELKVIAP